MAVTKLLNLLAVSSLAILACSYGATPVSALSIDNHHLARSPAHGHAALAKKRRASSKRCKPRPTSSLSSSAGTTTTPPATPPAPPKTTPPASSSSTKAAPAPTSSAGSGGGGGNSGSNSGSGKAGLGWPQDDDTALINFKTNQVTAYDLFSSIPVLIYNWSPWISTKAKSLGYNAIPMMWGEKQAADFKRLVVRGYAETVLGFNEPNQSGQSDMTPQRAAQLWQEYIQPLKPQGYSLITPACTNAPSGKTWQQEFMAACKGCSFDGLAIHWYGTKAQDFIDYITDMHNTFGLPIWVTEYACQSFDGRTPQCTKDQVFSFMSQTKNFMDNTPWVARYFWFGAMYDMGNVNSLNQLLGPGGKPTALGNAYIY
ncbi:hypothetical protein H0H81_005963 [Sphagnurus paluster]|uniref:Asl1-like glycosyl hydrolase catalytic domain-containing protein n=1 Tax=Sphagnurus paluster TaxID=117069 RepID=A0A9P7K6R4_9AGAR|nr:hypothetical protein H0H81_005963 [Sphagnurus paluster]